MQVDTRAATAAAALARSFTIRQFCDDDDVIAALLADEQRQTRELLGQASSDIEETFAALLEQRLSLRSDGGATLAYCTSATATMRIVAGAARQSLPDPNAVESLLLRSSWGLGVETRLDDSVRKFDDEVSVSALLERTNQWIGGVLQKSFERYCRANVNTEQLNSIGQSLKHLEANLPNDT